MSGSPLSPLQSLARDMEASPPTLGENGWVTAATCVRPNSRLHQQWHSRGYCVACSAALGAMSVMIAAGDR